MNTNKVRYMSDETVRDMKDKSKINATYDDRKHRLGDTEISFFYPGQKNPIYKTKNKIILPGAGFTARAHWNITNTEVTPSYNTALGLENSVYSGAESEEKVWLFCVGTDGCGREPSQVYKVNYAKWIMPEALVPFRYVLYNEDIDPTLRNKYFGRVEKGEYIAYYFKSFESDPTFVQQFVDGTPIDSTIYDSTREEEVESYIDVRLSITKEECREYFIQTTGINDARINTISLCTGWAKEFENDEGRKFTYYQDIRPLTKLNFPSEPLIDLSKGLDIIYHIYY